MHGILPAGGPEILEPSDLCESKTDTRRQPPGDVKKRFCGKVDGSQVKSFAHNHEVNQRKHQGSHKVSNKRQHIPCWKSSCYSHTLFLYFSFPFECLHQSHWSWVTSQTDLGLGTCLKNQRLLSRRFWNRSALVWNSKFQKRKGERIRRNQDKVGWALWFSQRVKSEKILLLAPSRSFPLLFPGSVPF